MLISRIEPTLPIGAQPQSSAGWQRPGLSNHQSRRPAALVLAFSGHAIVLATLVLLIRHAVLPEPPPISGAVSMVFAPEASPAPSAPQAAAPPAAAPAPAALEAPSPPAPAPPSAPLEPVSPPPEPAEPAPAPTPVVPAPPIPVPPPPAAEAPPEPAPPRTVARPTPPHPAPARPTPARPAVRKPEEARRPIPTEPSAEQPTGTSRAPASSAPAAPSSPAPAAPSLGPTISAAPLPGNSKPPYPMSARRMGEQGRVMVTITLSASGTPEAVSVATSSGHPTLDEAAVNAIRGWRFRPAQRNGQAVGSTLVVPVTFRLDDD